MLKCHPTRTYHPLPLHPHALSSYVQIKYPKIAVIISSQWVVPTSDQVICRCSQCIGGSVIAMASCRTAVMSAKGSLSVCFKLLFYLPSVVVSCLGRSSVKIRQKANESGGGRSQSTAVANKVSKVPFLK